MRRVILGLFLTSSPMAAASSAVAAPAPSCQAICDTLTACRPQGSYCKVNSPVGDNLCSGLYFRDIARTQPCSANDPTCPQAIPVRCPTTPSPPPSTITCENICAITPTCAFSRTHQGTYCETERSVPTCFGLYWRDLAATIPCYWQTDRTCPQRDPIRCG